MIHIIEIKVLHEFYFKYLIKNPETVYWNKQLSFYADKIAEIYDNEVAMSALIIDRNTGKTAILNSEYEYYIEDVEVLNTCFENNVLPACEDEKECEKCQLKKLCKNNTFDSLDEFIFAVNQTGLVE
jgi:hypothetical protein